MSKILWSAAPVIKCIYGTFKTAVRAEHPVISVSSTSKELFLHVGDLAIIIFDLFTPVRLQFCYKSIVTKCVKICFQSFCLFYILLCCCYHSTTF